jgi:transcription elongation factor GreA
MTPACHRLLRERLKKLKEVDRPANSKAIEIARGHGDLSENADYDAAKDEQAMIEAKIREAETKLALAEVIDPTSLSGDVVRFGATVTVEDVESGEQRRFAIVGEDESDVKAGRISVKAPIARAVIGKAIGDTAQIRSPGGMREVEIAEVEWLPVELEEL